MENTDTNMFDLEDVGEFLDNRLAYLGFTRDNRLSSFRAGDNWASYEFFSNGDLWHITHLWVNLSIRDRNLRICGIDFGVKNQRRGYGSQVLGFLEELARDYGCTTIQAWRIQNAGGVAFFEEQGFIDPNGSNGTNYHMIKPLVYESTK